MNQHRPKQQQQNKPSEELEQLKQQQATASDYLINKKYFQHS